MNMYGLLDPLPATEDPRGGPVRWYGMGIPEMSDAIHARGAGIAQLNHPRLGCAYLCTIGYDRLTGLTELTDPLSLGFEADSTVWGFEFDAVELMNGLRDPFIDPDDPEGTGVFEDWMSFLNLGHRVTATAVTDSHGPEMKGPVTFVELDDADPGALDEAALVDSILAGRAQVSGGAFVRLRASSGASEAGLGGLLSAAGGDLTLHVQVQALPEIDVQEVRILANCDVITTLATTDPSGVTKLDVEVPLTVAADAHLVLLAFGSGPMPRGLDGYDPARVPRLITNPLYVDADGDGAFTPPGGKTCATGQPGAPPSPL